MGFSLFFYLIYINLAPFCTKCYFIFSVFSGEICLRVHSRFPPGCGRGWDMEGGIPSSGLVGCGGVAEGGH